MPQPINQNGQPSKQSESKNMPQPTLPNSILAKSNLTAYSSRADLIQSRHPHRLSRLNPPLIVYNFSTRWIVHLSRGGERNLRKSRGKSPGLGKEISCHWKNKLLVLCYNPFSMPFVWPLWQLSPTSLDSEFKTVSIKFSILFIYLSDMATVMHTNSPLVK